MYIRSTKPGYADRYFRRKVTGGLSSCIQGSPTDPECDVLANCVGLACGAYNESCDLGYEKYYLNCNAENFIERAITLGLKVQLKPVKGGVMVWQKGATLSGSDGAGHVAYVTKDEKEMGANRVYTSESGYGSKAFWNATREKGNGNWGAGAGYTYRGCIVPLNYVPEPTPTPTPSKTYDVVKTIPGYVNSNNAANRVNSNSSVAPGNYFVFNEANGMINITRTSGTPGWWINPGDNVIVPEPTPTPTPQPTGLKKGDRVRLIGLGNANSYGTGISTGRQTIGWEREVLNNPSDLAGRSNPIQVGNSTGTTGWFKETALEKI